MYFSVLKIMEKFYHKKNKTIFFFNGCYKRWKNFDLLYLYIMLKVNELNLRAMITYF